MPKKTNNVKRKKAAPARVVEKREEPVVVERIDAVHGIYPDRMQTESAVEELKREGFPESVITVSPVGECEMAGMEMPMPMPSLSPETSRKVNDFGGAVARVAGGLLGLGTFAVAGPAMGVLLPALSVFGIGTARAIDAVESTVRMPRMPRMEPVIEGPALVNVNTEDPVEAKHATKTLQATGGQAVGVSGRYRFAGNDLKRREYRDAEGQVHHHTRSFLRDHASEEAS